MKSYPVTVQEFGTFEVPENTKLVLAIEGNGVDISHRCGGNARCTTCRVAIEGGDPPMGDAERECLVEDEVLGQFRLACQIRVHEPLTVRVLMRASDQGWEPGPEVEP
jgi:ferredoxin